MDEFSSSRLFHRMSRSRTLRRPLAKSSNGQFVVQAPTSARPHLPLNGPTSVIAMGQGIVYQYKDLRQLYLAGGCTGCGAVLFGHAAIFSICPLCRQSQFNDGLSTRGTAREESDAAYDDSDEYEDFEDEYESDEDDYEDFDDDYDDD